MKPKATRNMFNKKINVSENSAEPCRNNEVNWIIQWTKNEGLEKYIGEIINLPELVLDHIAGRVYKVQTKSNKHFFVVVGYGRLSYYAIKKELNEPKEILSLHRGSALITRMKFKYIREKRGAIK